MQWNSPLVHNGMPQDTINSSHSSISNWVSCLHNWLLLANAINYSWLSQLIALRNLTNPTVPSICFFCVVILEKWYPCWESLQVIMGIILILQQIRCFCIFPIYTFHTKVHSSLEDRTSPSWVVRRLYGSFVFILAHYCLCRWTMFICTNNSEQVYFKVLATTAINKSELWISRFCF